MKDNPEFNPKEVQKCKPHSSIQTGAGGDDRDGRVYVYHKSEIALAVKVALATGRPLLLGGPSGCGKSTLALNVALTLGWRYYEHVVTSRAEARDFLYRFDSIRRLNDAQTPEQLKKMEAYIEPGVLWWAFNRESAIERGAKGKLPSDQRATDPCKVNSNERAVVLIDEIDKADVDVPNNLLVPLGSLQFKVEHTGFEVAAKNAPLIFITTNGERELPLAFLRRCVTLELEKPDADLLVKIAIAKIPEEEHDEALFLAIANHVLAQAIQEERTAGLPPSTAEYLDTVRACLDLEIKPGDQRFTELSRITLRKRQSVQGASR